MTKNGMPTRDESRRFERRPMVNWFAPAELVRAGIKALLSSLFGAYADKREVQAALSEQVVFDYSGHDELWLDYVADLGDGFDATYTVARLLGAETLQPAGAGGPLPRGRILLLGGDQVYPTASRQEYQDRFAGPYEAALPWVEEGPTGEGQVPEAEALTPMVPVSAAGAPGMYAVPGNHDWYDGLTSFTRLFCQRRWIGGWRTRQRRSYFALKLPHDWWVWGIDVQLGSDVDQPQIDFFLGLAGDDTRMPRGSRIILCTAEPSWVYAELRGGDAYQNLEYFEKRVIAAHGHRVAVSLAGDLHTYARYERQDAGEGASRRLAYVCGGGGAYLYPSHDLPAELKPLAAGGSDRYTCKGKGGHEHLFPCRDKSRQIAWGSLGFAYRNVAFSAFLGGLYLVLAWLLQSTSVVKEGVQIIDGVPQPSRATLLETIAATPLSGIGTVLGRVWGLLIHSPGTLVLVAGVVAGLIAFARIESRPEERAGTGGRWKALLRKSVAGGSHAAAHLLLFVLLAWLFAAVNLGLMGLHHSGLVHLLLYGAEMVVIGGAAGGTLMGAYLLVANRLLGLHSNEVFLCQSIPDYKHFLRMRLSGKGELTIYAVGIRRVCRKWRFVGGNSGRGAPWYEPAGGEGAIAGRAQLIDGEVRVH